MRPSFGADVEDLQNIGNLRTRQSISSVFLLVLTNDLIDSALEKALESHVFLRRYIHIHLHEADGEREMGKNGSGI